METFGWTDHFCSLPVVPADAGPCLPVLLVALCPGWPGCGCRAGQSQLSCWKGPVLSLPSLALFLRAVPHILLLPWQPGAQIHRCLEMGGWKFVVQGWDAMLNLGLCHSFPGLCAVLLGAGN